MLEINAHDPEKEIRELSKVQVLSDHEEKLFCSSNLLKCDPAVSFESKFLPLQGETVDYTHGL